MDFYYDALDRIGGYPYEYASEREIVNLVCERGFECQRSAEPTIPTGCREFVFQKVRTIDEPG